MRGPLHLLRTTWDFVVDVAKQWYYGGLGDLAAGVTFWILLTLPAAVLALVSGLGWIGSILGTGLKDDVETGAVDFAARLLGSNVSSVESAIRDLFVEQNSGLLTISLLLALWTISRGFAGLLRALDGVYDVEDGRAWYYTRVVALVLGLGTLVIIAAIALLEVFVWSRYEFPMEATIRASVSVFILLLWAVLIYHFGPSVRTKWHWDLPGALVAGSMWWMLTIGFGIYVDVTSGGNEAAAAIGAFILALTWVWLAAQVLLIGAAVNSLLGSRLGINRAKRDWRINERIFRTGEMKRVDIEANPTPPPDTILGPWSDTD
ncbi:MAG: YihY/virulence factor BrkB family protein [Acidimicrobiales bacterium]